MGVLVLVARTTLATAVPPCATEAAWLRADSGHFAFFSSAGEQRTLRLARLLERLHDALAAMGLRDEPRVPARTCVFAFADRACFAPFRPRWLDTEEAYDGYFQPSSDGDWIVLYAAFESSAHQIACHEYVHAVLHARYRSLPLCLNEGLAGYFSTLDADDTTATFGHPREGALLWLDAHPLLPARELFRVGAASDEYRRGERRSTFYAESWALVHYLLSLEGGGRRLRDLCDRIEAGEEATAAFCAAFPSEPWRGLERRLESYLRSGHLGARTVRLAGPSGRASARVRPMDRREVLFQMGSLLEILSEAQGVEAGEYFAAALGPDSSHAPSLARLGRLALRRGEDLEAQRLFERAERLDPENPQIHYLAGTASFARLFADTAWWSGAPDTVPATLTEARRHLARCLALDPGDVLALAAYGRTFALEHRGAPEAIEALTKAHEALPARTDILLDLVEVLARAGRKAEALTLVEEHLEPAGLRREVAAAEWRIHGDDLRRADALARAKRYAEAESLMRAVASQVTDARLVADLAKRLEAVSRARAASAAIEDYNRGVEAWNRGDLDEARRSFERARKKAPGSAVAGEAAKQIERIEALRKESGKVRPKR